MLQGSGWNRLVIEKPFGYNPESAEQLNEQIRQVFKEEEIYRIDHYLGKEMVQNIEVIRFANAFFEPLWNNKHIANIQITLGETVGVEERGGYYDHAGALRDMGQNHILQLLTMIAMAASLRFLR
ncbi:Glucose-6-phosphate 1-dehydrogenase [compost metagenome]